MTLQPPPAGWYPNPEPGGEGMRWWDGQRWTDAPAPTGAGQVVPSQSARWKSIALGVGLLVAALIALPRLTDFIQDLGSSGSVTAADLETEIRAGLREQGIRMSSLDCVEPGAAASAGDQTACNGETRRGVPVSISVTFNSDGSYVWETR